MATIIYRPTSDGTYNELLSTGASHYTEVDDSSQDTTTYVSTDNATGLTDTYGFETPSQKGNITRIRITSCSLSPATAAITRNVLYIGTTLYSGSDDTLMSYYKYFYTTWTTNPATSVAWQWSDLTDLQFGIFLEGDRNDLSRCTQIYLEIFYTPIPVYMFQYRQRWG
jgi:hypothetical protein